MSGEDSGYVPPDHKTTAEFRVPGRAAAPDAGTAADSTVVDDLADATVQDFPADDPEDAPEVTLRDLPADDPEDDPQATSQDPPDDPGATSRDAPEKASATVTDIRLGEPAPPQEEAAAFAQGAVPAPAPSPVVGETPWTEQFGAESASTDAGAPAFPLAMPSGPAPQHGATAPVMPSGGVPPRRSRRPLILVGAVGVVLLVAAAAVVALLLTRGGSDGGSAAPPSSPPSPPGASAPAGAGGPTGGPTPGGPAPSEAPAAGQPPAQQPGAPGTPPPATTAPIGPLVRGKGITYQLVQQDEGYFEGRMVITNRTDRPMKTWKLTFRAPGADVKNIWGARLVRGGEKVEIRNLDGAPAIPPGGTWEIQYGAAGRASTPKGCELNGGACGF
ncbi:cellulose binding domain-containing protein [Actinomadura sp.]|uniref:cellulose binding domain-containing protein n=1 Tax=Actinomadura sp. TaxID=1989 RepID=UPI0037C85365